MLQLIKSLALIAPDRLLNIIRCTGKYKSRCDTRRCTCRKHGLDCTVACSECKVVNCSNCQPAASELDDHDEIDD